MEYPGVACDWITGRHEYAAPVPVRESGRIMKIDRDGVIEYETQTWESIKCSSSETSIRVKCDGRTLRFMGNIGRFGEQDNELGLTVMQCMDKWAEVLRKLVFDLSGFGTRGVRKVNTEAGYGEAAGVGQGSPLECGTYLTRIDLCHNFDVSDYAALAGSMMVKRIGQKLPMAGKYGPTWGYDANRSNWYKAKLYDKTAELQGKRTPNPGATRARFEVQLGSEYLKREGLDQVKKWKGEDMAKVIYGHFANQVFRDQLDVQDWTEIPAKLRVYAILWRDGINLKTQFKSLGGYYKVRAKLMDYGIDVSTPCNVLALTRRCRIVEVTPVSTLREAA